MPLKAKATATTDHEEIRRWAEERGATPACVRGTGGKGDIGMLRLDFPGYSGAESLEPIEWNQWFEKFDERGLALLHQETTARGQQSNFNKLLSRETAKAREQGDREASARTLRAVSGGKEKSAGRTEKVARQPKRSSEVKSAQKRHPVANIRRKQEGAKPSPHSHPGKHAA